MTTLGYTLQYLKHGDYTLAEDVDYFINGNSVTIKTSYLNTLDLGEQVIIFELSGGSNPRLTITVADGAISPAESRIQPQPITSQMPINPFVDVSGSDWFIGEVIYVYSNGLMAGASTGTDDVWS